MPKHPSLPLEILAASNFCLDHMDSERPKSLLVGIRERETEGKVVVIGPGEAIKSLSAYKRFQAGHKVDTLELAYMNSKMAGFICLGKNEVVNEIIVYYRKKDLPKDFIYSQYSFESWRLRAAELMQLDKD